MLLLSVLEFFGRFHPVLVHLPIGVLLTGLLLQWLSRNKNYGIPPQVIKVVLLFGTISALLSCITGYILSISGDYDASLVGWHMWMGIGVTIISMLLFMKVSRQEFDLGYKALSIGLLVAITVTGHLGGSLTHGADYLTAPLKSHRDSGSVKQKPIANIQEAKLYDDVIQPLLKSKCYSCHGTVKQKGKFRMDDPQWLMKGGKDGVVIVPGKDSASELIKRLLLPVQEDHHMPPKQKPQLNEKQIALLHWWIEEGADFNKKVKDYVQPATIQTYLLSLQGSTTERKAPPDIPLDPVSKADEKAILNLKDKGVVVMPVSQNSNYLMANFITASQISNLDIALLLPLRKQLVWLKLGNSSITDSALYYIGQCSALTILQLNNTGITDKGLHFLEALKNLRSLNLVGTAVTAEGLVAFHSLKSLHSIYLYSTGVKKSDWKKLQQAFPKVMLDSGGYSVPLLETDTTVLKPPVTKQQ